MAILEAASLKSRCPQGHALSEDWRLLPCLFQPLRVTSHPWPSLASRQYTTPVSASVFTSHSPCMCLGLNSPLLIRTPVIESGPTLLQWPHLNLNTSTKTLFPNKDTVTGTGFRTCTYILRDTIQPTTAYNDIYPDNFNILTILKIM